jgi:hypothetical protein
VAATSRVSVVVIVWRAMGCALPTGTLPIMMVLRRARARQAPQPAGARAGRRSSSLSLPE